MTCQEGGCGACVVALTKPDPITGKQKTMAVNSVSEEKLKPICCNISLLF